MKLTSLYLFLILFPFLSTLHAQETVDELIDRLAAATTAEEKSKLSRGIARRLVESDWEQTAYYLERAEENINEVTSDLEWADYYNEVGTVYIMKDALDIALDYFLRAYEIYEGRDEDTKQKVGHNIAVIYGRMKRLDEALPYFREAYVYARKQGDSLIASRVLNNLGSGHFQLKQLDSSLYYFDKALEMGQEIPDDSFFEAYVRTNIGRSWAAKELPDAAVESFHQALQLLKDQKGRHSSTGYIYNTIARFYYDNGQADSAVYYAQKATDYMQEMPYLFDNQEALQVLYRSHLLAGDYENAATHFERYNEVRDSLYIMEKTANVERIEVEAEFRAKEKVRDLQQRARMFKIYIVGLCLFVVLLIVVMLLVRYRNRFVKTQLKNELIQARENELSSRLELKNNELIGKAMVELHRAEIIQEVLEELKNTKRKAAKKETRDAIDQILRSLQRGIDSDIWQEFETVFEQVHESFYKKLQQQHPDLTARDKRLCAMLKLNLSTKEISQLTGQSFKSVENARTRLRKKLSLTNTKEELSGYLGGLG